MHVGFSALNQSSYGVIPHIQHQLMQGIREAGGTPIMCRTVRETKDLDFFVLVNSLSLQVQKEIIENVGQYWTYLLDAPFHHAGWIWLGPPSVNYAVVDPSHRQLLSLLNRQGVFFPHGGETHAFRAWKDREIDLLFTGTAPSLDQASELLDGLSLDLRDLTKAFTQEALANPQRNLLDLLIEFLKQQGANLKVSDSMSILTIADNMVRATHRLNLLAAFSDFSVVIAGSGWEVVDRSPNHQWIGEVAYKEVPELMSQAKIVLCPHCGFTQGGHDRILSAMGCGAVPLTVPTPYLETSFQHGIHLAYFKDLQEAVDLGRLILNGSHWEVVGEAGHRAVASAHSWNHRGKELFSLLSPSTPSQSPALSSIPQHAARPI